MEQSPVGDEPYCSTRPYPLVVSQIFVIVQATFFGLWFLLVEGVPRPASVPKRGPQVST